MKLFIKLNKKNDNMVRGQEQKDKINNQNDYTRTIVCSIITYIGKSCYKRLSKNKGNQFCPLK